MTHPVVIVDLDGCLCDDRHRYHLAELAFRGETSWDEYHRRHVDDRPYDNECMMVRAWRETNKGSIIVSTSRPDRYRESTVAWLRRHRLWISWLMMRGDNDFRPSAQVKREHLFRLPATVKILWAMDDDNDVVAMYRAEGILCLQPRTRPKPLPNSPRPELGGVTTGFSCRGGTVVAPAEKNPASDPLGGKMEDPAGGP